MGSKEVTTDHRWLQLPDNTLAQYNSWDTYSTALLARRMPQVLEETYNKEFWDKEYWPAINPIVRLMERGLPIDKDEKTRLRRWFRSEVRECDDTIRKAAGHSDFNPNSDTQVRRLLFGGDRQRRDAGEEVEFAKGLTTKSLGLKPSTTTDTGLFAVNADALLRVLHPRAWRKKDEPHRGLLHALLHRSRYVKLDEYLEFETEDRGAGPRVYPTVKPYGTESIRLSYAEPPIHSWAHELRTMVRPREGRVLLGADFSQLEARIAAYLSGDPKDIAIYERTDRPPYKHHPDWDIHSQTVAECFSIEEPDWRAMSVDLRNPYRDWSKTFRYGVLLYGGAAETAKTKAFCPCPKCEAKAPTILDLSRDELSKVAERWFLAHPSFVEWRSRLLEPFQGTAPTNTLTTCFGFHRAFAAPYNDALRREIYNFPIQHAGAIIKLRALRRLDALGVPLVLDHHDALYVECGVEWAPQTAKIVKREMERPVPEMDGARFPVELKIGQSWGELG